MSAFGLLTQYSRDLREFRRTGKSRDLSAWSKLFAGTNGMINDVTSFALRQLHGRMQYGDTTGILGTLSTADRKEIIRTLRRDSYYIFPQRMPEHILSAIETAALRTPARVSPKFSDNEKLVYDPNDPKAAIYNWGQSLVNVPEMQALMTDETFTAIATDYLKVDPILDSAMPWLSIAYGNGPSHEGAQLYHYDLSHLRWLKLYVYLTDVGPMNGPHCLVKGTQGPLDLKGARLRRRGQVRISDEDIVSTYGADRVVEVTAPRGTVFAVDTRAFHKGKQVFNGERIMLELYYVNANYGVSTPPEPITNPSPQFGAAAARWPRMLSHYPIAERSSQAIILNDDGVAINPDILEMLLASAFPDQGISALVRSEIDSSVTQAPSVKAAMDALTRYAEARPTADPRSQQIIEMLRAHKLDTASNSSTYPMRARNQPHSGFWPIPTDPENGRSLFRELPYRKKKALLTKATPIVSAGSCFAVEIARHFQASGFNYLITEPESAADGSYKMRYADDNLVSSSAAWGVIFNTPSFRQLAEKAFGARQLPKILFESRAGVYHDPFREGVEFSSVTAFETNFPRHIEATRKALTSAKVLIITLGLNEVWSFKMDGSVFSRSPARIAPSFVSKKVMTVQENVADLEVMLGLLRKHNPDIELIVTLSPIGLHATFLENEKHVVEANTHSKAVLRVAAEEFVARNQGVHYFPSYELVMNGIETPWDADQRHVTPATVSRVMEMFHEMYVVS